MAEIQILPLASSLWNDAAKIYFEGIQTKNATFETVVPDWNTWDAAHRNDCRLAAMDNSCIVGWAALSQVSRRTVYAGVAEISIYVDERFRHQGVGSALMKAMIEQSEAAGIWTLQAGIFPENTASIGLHKKFGFRIVGVREKIGMMDGVWRDLTFLERRSAKIGI